MTQPPRQIQGPTSGVANLSEVDLGSIYQYIQGRLPQPTKPGPTVPVTDITTVTAPQDGQQVLVRAGTTPYDFLAVTFDETTAQWVSEQRVLLSNEQSSGSITTYTDVSGDEPFVPWKVLDTAGFKPQYRLTFVTNTDGTHAVFGALQVYASDAAAAPATQGATFGARTSATTGIVEDSNWVNIPGSLTVKDFVGTRVQWKQASSGSGLISNVCLLGRWVSK